MKIDPDGVPCFSRSVSLLSYNAPGQIVLDDMSNWGGVKGEAPNNGLGRLFADYGYYGYGTRQWQREYLPYGQAVS